MRAFLVLVFCTTIRAQGWGDWTPPEDRGGLWLKICPTKDMPVLNTSMQYELFKFEGTDFYTEMWGLGISQLSLVRYFPQWGIRDSVWKVRFPELYFSGPSPLTTIAEKVGVAGIGFGFHRTF